MGPFHSFTRVRACSTRGLTEAEKKQTMRVFLNGGEDCLVIEYPVRETVVNDETDESWREIYVFFFGVANKEGSALGRCRLR